MADIDISLKFEYSVDPADIQKEIESAIKTINASPEKIKIDADVTEAKKSIDDLSKQISELKKQKIKLDIGTGDGSGGGGSKAFVKDTVAYNKALESLNNTITQTRAKTEKWTAAQQGQSKSSYDSLINQISALEQLSDKVQNGSVTVKDFSTEFSKIKLEIAEASNEISRFGENTKIDATLVSGTKEFSDALTKVDTALAQAQVSLQKWTAAQYGSSSGAYKDLGNQVTELENLRTSLESGTMTAKEFTTQYSQIKSAITESSAAIKTAGENHTKNSSAIAEETKAYKKLSSMMAEINRAKESMKSAAHGESSDAYNTYIEQANALKDLKKQYDDGSISLEQFKAGLTDIENTMAKSRASMGTFGNSFTQLISGIGKFLISYRVLMLAFSKVKEMIKASIEIESSMNRIQIVTGATDSQMSNFFETATSHAKELGTSITDIAGSLETFSRLGYNLEDASQLSKFATIMSNVADTSVDDATKGLTSIIKGFGMQVSEAEHVTDVLVEVGQKYAISAEELMQAFERGGASMNASGTSFEKTAALFAATNASLNLWRAA